MKTLGALLILILFAFDARAERIEGWNSLGLLTPDLYTKAQVCKNAESSGKPFALVAIKSHDCDYTGYQHCLKETYYLADSCNTATSKNFAIYHLRLFTNERAAWNDRTEWSKEQHAALSAEWGPELIPSWILLDLSTCSIVAKIPREELHTKKSTASGGILSGDFVPDSNDLLEEYELIATRVGKALEGIRPDAVRWSQEETKQCLDSSRRPSLIELWDHLDSTLKKDQGTP